MQSTQPATLDGSRPESVAGNVHNLAQRTEPTCPPKPRSHKTIHRFLVEAADVGIVGFVDGGKLLEWIDKAAYAAAAQWSGRYCVTASVGNIHLDRPISVGELVEVHASLVYTGRSSMHILVTIYSSDPTGAKAFQTSQCPIIFVAVDDTGNPVDVPPWTPVTMLDLQRQRQARVRIRMRKRIEGAIAAESHTAEGTAPRATPRFLAAPTDVNSGGKVHGGRVMGWIDEAAYVCGADWTGAQVITSYIAGIRFYRPIISRRRHRGHRTNHSHRTAQHPHQHPRHHHRHGGRPTSPRSTRTGRRRFTRPARRSPTCPTVGARLRRRPSTRSARAAPDRATAIHRTLHHCSRSPRQRPTGTLPPQHDRPLTQKGRLITRCLRRVLFGAANRPSIRNARGGFPRRSRV